MLIGQVIGARLGVKMVLSRGQQLIRPMIVLVSLAMSIKLLYQNYAVTLSHWLKECMIWLGRPVWSHHQLGI